MNDIVKQVGLPAMMEMLGEEGAEMTHACLKYARQLRGENPTPKTEKECRDALVEEMADVQLMIDLLTMSVPSVAMCVKKDGNRPMMERSRMHCSVKCVMQI